MAHPDTLRAQAKSMHKRGLTTVKQHERMLDKIAAMPIPAAVAATAPTAMTADPALAGASTVPDAATVPATVSVPAGQGNVSDPDPKTMAA